MRRNWFVVVLFLFGPTSVPAADLGRRATGTCCAGKGRCTGLITSKRLEGDNPAEKR